MGLKYFDTGPAVLELTVPEITTYPHLLQGFSQHITALLLVHKDDDGWVKALLQNVQQFLPVQGERRGEANR